MIKVGFVTTPLASGHSVRGVGAYTRRLLPELKKQAPGYDFEILEINSDHELSTNNYELVHYPYFDLFRHTLPILKNTKTVVTVHDVIPLEFPDHYPPGVHGWFNLQLQKLALANVDQVITVSYASVQAIRKHLLVPHAKLKLIYEAADPIFKKISKPKNKYNLPKEFVLYVGDVNWNKNIPSLVKACEQINYPLVIVGKQAAEVEKLNINHAELRHLQGVDWSKVIRLGFVSDEDLVVIYNLVKVYCQPSFAEGFGLPVVEALACGTPVACSNASSLPEIAGGSAAYFDPRDVNDMARAIKKAKPSVVSSKFSWAKAAAQTLQVYREMLDMY